MEAPSPGKSLDEFAKKPSLCLNADWVSCRRHFFQHNLPPNSRQRKRAQRKDTEIRTRNAQKKKPGTAPYSVMPGFKL